MPLKKSKNVSNITVLSGKTDSVRQQKSSRKTGAFLFDVSGLFQSEFLSYIFGNGILVYHERHGFVCYERTGEVVISVVRRRRYAP